MLVKILREKGERKYLHVHVKYKVIVDDGVDEYCKKHFGETFHMYLEKVFDSVNWLGDEDNFVYYECVLKVKDEDKLKDSETRLINGLNDLVEAFKNYVENLPVIEEKEWIWE